jgi:hypothetical protein
MLFDYMEPRRYQTKHEYVAAMKAAAGKIGESGKTE